MGQLTLNEIDVTNRVILNVGGTRFETYKQILKKIQATRLSRLTKALANYDPVTDEYFFDRHPGVFSQILNYYRTGKLHYPQSVCGPLFEEELVFWGIDSNQVEPCCWKTYTKHRQTEDTLMTLEKLNIDVERTPRNELVTKFSIDTADGYPNNLRWFKRIQPVVWQMFEEPRSSTPAKLIAVIQITTIFLSVAILWLSSGPMAQHQILELQEQHVTLRLGDNRTNSNLHQIGFDSRNLEPSTNPYAYTLGSSNNDNDSYPDYSSSIANNNTSVETYISTFRLVESPISPLLIGLDYFTLAWFLIDISVRFIFSPDKREYLRKFDNLIDMVATAWLIADLIIHFYVTSFLIHSFQVVRVLRLFRLFTYHPGLKVIILSIAKSGHILHLLVYFIAIASTLFGALIFFAEKLTTHDPANNGFISIPEAIWFSLVSLTTIGYGDLSPETFAGRCIGSICVMIGVIMVGLPMTIVVEVFTNFYKHLGARSKLPRQRRRICPVEAPRAARRKNPSQKL